MEQNIAKNNVSYFIAGYKAKRERGGLGYVPDFIPLALQVCRYEVQKAGWEGAALEVKKGGSPIPSAPFKGVVVLTAAHAVGQNSLNLKLHLTIGFMQFCQNCIRGDGYGFGHFRGLFCDFHWGKV